MECTSNEMTLALGRKSFALLRFQTGGSGRRHVKDSRENAAPDVCVPAILPNEVCRDSSGQGNHIGNSLYCLATDAGRIGGGARLQRGNGGFILVPHSSSLNAANGLTIEAWLWLDPEAPVSDYQRIICKSSTDVSRDTYGAREYDLAVGPQGDLQFWLRLNSSRFLLEAPANSLTKGVWSHLAATFDGSSMCMYVNGAMKASHPAQGEIDQTVGPLVIGNSYGYGFREQFSGIIDEVHLWNKARSEDQIKNDMASSPEAKSDGLMACWRFEKE